MDRISRERMIYIIVSSIALCVLCMMWMAEGDTTIIKSAGVLLVYVSGMLSLIALSWSLEERP